MQKIIFLLILFTITFDYCQNKFEEENCDVLHKNPANYLADVEKNLTFGRNILNVEKDETYILDFKDLINNSPGMDLLIYTDLYTVQDKISQFDIFNESEYTNKKIAFTSNAKKSGFIDVEKVNKYEYIINKNTEREDFYKGVIAMKKNKVESQFYINIIPKDNNSDLYFFQTNKSSVRDNNKDRIKLYYLNDFENKNLKEIIAYIKEHPMKRERCINGKAEIFGYSYDNLDKNIDISISYKQIKGTGTLGPILSLSILFAGLVVVTIIFFKNTYCDTGYRSKMDSNIEE